jgi:hypothetical protein
MDIKPNLFLERSVWPSGKYSRFLIDCLTQKYKSTNYCVLDRVDVMFTILIIYIINNFSKISDFFSNYVA